MLNGLICITMCIEGYEKKGIGYIRYYRDYDTGIIKGYLMIEYQSPLLINNFYPY